MYSCSKCMVTFSLLEEFKIHCGSKWHAYNHMRCTQERQPITLQAFEALAQKIINHQQSSQEQVSLSCNFCNKTFSSDGTFSSHLQSRSHKNKAAKFPPKPSQERHQLKVAAPDVRHREAQFDATLFSDQSEDEEDLWESDGSWEELNCEDGGAEETSPARSPCVLCLRLCDGGVGVLQHMQADHSFCVPHRDSCNLHRLYIRLAQTVLQLLRCPQCARQFSSSAAVQRHMTDKPHLTINPLGKHYRRCYKAAVFASRLEMPQTSPDSCVFELTLASGARLTPRSLALYSRQSLRHEATKPRATLRRLALQAATLRQTGYGVLQTAVAHRSRNQQLGESRCRGRQQLSIATRGNALRHRIRLQVVRAG